VYRTALISRSVGSGRLYQCSKTKYFSPDGCKEKREVANNKQRCTPVVGGTYRISGKYVREYQDLKLTISPIKYVA